MAIGPRPEEPKGQILITTLSCRRYSRRQYFGLECAVLHSSQTYPYCMSQMPRSHDLRWNRRFSFNRSARHFKSDTAHWQVTSSYHSFDVSCHSDTIPHRPTSSPIILLVWPQRWIEGRFNKLAHTAQSKAEYGVNFIQVHLLRNSGATLYFRNITLNVPCETYVPTIPLLIVPCCMTSDTTKKKHRVSFACVPSNIRAR
jgi:hypothetical protein